MQEKARAKNIERASRDEREIQITNANAEALNKEALETLAFVADIFEADTSEQP